LKSLKQQRAGRAKPKPRKAALEREIIAHFAQLGRAIGAPKSLGAIYGCLFANERPVSFDEIVRLAGLSTGSVSQGLKTLRSLGAARTVIVPGERRDHFVAETRLRLLLVGFLRGTIEREMSQGEERLQALLAQAEALPSRNGHKALGQRMQVLQNWHAQARVALPMLVQLLGGSAQD
jgi:DNA-binding transcriptional regulator GbsR (MarR family)